MAPLGLVAAPPGNGPSPRRAHARALATGLVRPLSRLRARALPPGRRLHLGCGPTRLPGWTNVDLLGRSRVDLALDLRRPLPFRDRSVDAIFHEHLLEHLSYSDALALLEECRRVLRPGGVLRVCVPDFGRYARSYASGDAFLEALRPGRPTRLLALAEVAYSHGHRSVWDAETLTGTLDDLGLDAAESSFGRSRLSPCPDSAGRANESLYVEAVAPTPAE